MKPLPMNATAMRLCVWSGAALLLFFFAGLVAFAGIVPPRAPSDSAETVASWYRENATFIRIGMVAVVAAAPFFGTFGAAIAVWTRRGEQAFPVLTYTQLICLGFIVVTPVLTGTIWGLAAYRPDEVAAETTRLLNDFGWFIYLFTGPPFTVQLVAIGLGIIWDKSERPAFPRWLAYYNFWVAFTIIPSCLMIFFKRGPFGFNGLVAFWVPTVFYFSWFAVMGYMVLRAISAEQRRAALAEPVGQHAVLHV
jgi:succinate dehydrogenase/fumarate reductase cytochrome b subunit